MMKIAKKFIITGINENVPDQNGDNFFSILFIAEIAFWIYTIY